MCSRSYLQQGSREFSFLVKIINSSMLSSSSAAMYQRNLCDQLLLVIDQSMSRERQIKKRRILAPSGLKQIQKHNRSENPKGKSLAASLTLSTSSKLKVFPYGVALPILLDLHNTVCSVAPYHEGVWSDGGALPPSFLVQLHSQALR